MKKKMGTLFLVLVMCLSICIPVNAEENTDVTTNSTNNFTLTLTNNETGTVQTIDATPVTYEVQTRAGEKVVTVGYSAFVPILKEVSENTRTSEVGGKDDGSGVSVLFYVVYTISSDGVQIKVSRIYGSWTPDSSLFTVSNREVGMHAGLDSPGTLTKHPTSNSFDYSTGWGYCNFVPAGDASPYAWADATITVYGMSGSHRLTAGLAFPESRG